jgi:hypothetical protein
MLNIEPTPKFGIKTISRVLIKTTRVEAAKEKRQLGANKY